MNLRIYRLKDRLNAYAGFFVVMGLFSMFMLTNCNSEPEVFGNNLLPGDDINTIRKYSETDIKAYTVSQDTFAIGNQGVLMLGYLNDPDFGTTKAGFITQFQPITFGHRFGTDPIADSIVLNLQRKSFIGDEDVQLNITIYGITDTLITSSLYYSNFDYTSLIGAQIYQSDLVFNKHTARVKLPLSIATYLVDITDTLMDGYAPFVDYFKGFYISITSEPTNNQLNLFNVSDVDNNLTVYYKNVDAVLEGEENLEFSYVVGSTVTYMNIIEKAFTGTHLETILNDTINQDSIFFVQGLGGSLGLINFSDLLKWRDSTNFAFNKVELRIPVNENYSDENYYPSELVLKYFRDTMFYYLPDSLVGGEFMGGDYSSTDNEYTFRITRYASNLVTGDTDINKLYVFNKSNLTSPKNVILNTRNHSKPMKLDITYTKFN